MSEASELLATLRDIGEPPAPDGVPAVLVITNLCLLLIVIGAILRRRHQRRHAWRRAALRSIRATHQDPPHTARLKLAQVLRRIMHHRHGAEIDALHGDAWLARLDETFNDDWFTAGDGRAFGDALYTREAHTTFDTEHLARELARRVKRLAEPHPASTPTGGPAANPVQSTRTRERALIVRVRQRARDEPCVAVRAVTVAAAVAAETPPGTPPRN